MNIYLMRHAHAVEADEWNGPDATRPLTDKGRKAADAATRGLARLPDPISRIISSPYDRARETAEIVGQRLGVSVSLHDGLTVTRAPLKCLIGALREEKYAPNLLFVGHQPMLGQILAQIQGNCQGEVDMKKAAVACVSLPHGPGHAEGADINYAHLLEGSRLVWLRRWKELAALAEDSGEEAQKREL